MFDALPFPHLSKDIKAHSTATFVGGVFLAEGCEVGENCIVDGSKFRITIKSNCKIGKNTKIIAELDKIEIGPNVIIGDNCVISSSIEENSFIENDQTILSNYN
ncbi:MAG: hypothetical protein GPJ54_07805 [Candidatus Heimdallarchaeota archaeon]|nr:hypothetical protein [Candidatus Heimdallarchaeota archaeon]